jgi:ATP-binding cassette subfamily F protein uup
VDYHVGNYDRYLEKRAEAQAASVPSPAVAAVPAPVAASKPRKLKWKEERELEAIEGLILAAEEEVARLENLFSQPNFYAESGQQWAQIEAQLAAARHEVARLYARWQELELIQEATA